MMVMWDETAGRQHSRPIDRASWTDLPPAELDRQTARDMEAHAAAARVAEAAATVRWLLAALLVGCAGLALTLWSLTAR